jgi:L-rhamnose mutarotase
MSYLILLCTLKYIFIFYHVNIIQMEKFEVEAEAGLKNYSIFLNPAEDIKIVFVF